MVLKKYFCHKFKSKLGNKNRQEMRKMMNGHFVKKMKRMILKISTMTGKKTIKQFQGKLREEKGLKVKMKGSKGL